MQTLEKLYDNFYKPSKQLSLQKEVDENHKILISNLSKADRKCVLRIIDVKDLISGIHKRESFICGFKLALDLLEELKYENKCDYVSEISEVQSHFSTEEKNNEDA